MVLLGCKPAGRLTEQHDIFFGVAGSLKELVPHMINSWPEANGEIHIDSWREVTKVGDYVIQVIPKKERLITDSSRHLFFINLGGYKPGEFEEYHYKILAVGKDSSEAIQRSKQSTFYKHCGFEYAGAVSHIDDKYGIDTDDLFKIEDVLAESFKRNYTLELALVKDTEEDVLHIGYVQIKKLLAS